MKKIIVLFLIGLTVLFNSLAQAQSLYGIIVPFADESIILKKHIKQRKTKIIEGITYQMGILNGRKIVFVHSGEGIINAAITTTRLINDFHPNLILMSGSAGSTNPKLKNGDIVIGQTVSDVDFGKLTSKGIVYPWPEDLHNPGFSISVPLEFQVSNKLIPILNQIKEKSSLKIVLGKIATSDQLPNSPPQVELMQQAGFDAVEMEGAAMMQTCYLFHTPCLVIRGISNVAGKPVPLSDIKMAGDESAKVLIDIISLSK